MDSDEKIMNDIKSVIGSVIKIPVNRIKSNRSFLDYGFDSITLAEFAEELNHKYNIALNPSLFFKYSSIDKLIAYIKEESSQSEKEETETLHNSNALEGKENSIAIVGTSSIIGKTKNIDEFWNALEKGENHIDYFLSDRYTKTGNSKKYRCACIEDVFNFDYKFFNIPYAEASSMDPRQRLLLQESWKALEDAGYGQEELRNHKIGVFIGAEDGDYHEYLRNKGNLTSAHSAILSARLAYFMDFKGPNMTINTACSSGLAALHEACVNLENNVCDLAVVGSANIVFSTSSLDKMNEVGMLSPRGKCSAFDSDADGIVPGEAVVVFILKKLNNAKTDGNQIYGIIKGHAINFDGRSNGITAPNYDAQTELLQQLYEKQEFNDVSYIVTHGTGTKLGDPVEYNVIKNIFKKLERHNPCVLSSNKGNFGHTGAASGLVNVLNLLMSFKYKKIPKSLNYNKMNEFLELDEGLIYINENSASWDIEENKIRKGGASSFGMSGTNVHMVMEEYINSLKIKDVLPYYIIPFSAKSKSSLANIIDNYLNLESVESMSALMNTLIRGRTHFSYRTAFIVKDFRELKLQMKEWKAQKLRTGIYYKEINMEENVTQKIKKRLVKEFQGISAESEYFTKACEIGEMFCNGASLDCEGIFDKNYLIHLPLYCFDEYNCSVTPASHDCHKLELNTIAQRSPNKQSKASIRDKDITIINNVKTSLVNFIGGDKSVVSEDDNFVSLGLDSVSGVEWINQINKLFSLSLNTSTIYDYTTIKQLGLHISHLVESEKGNEEKETAVEAGISLEPTGDRQIILSDLNMPNDVYTEEMKEHLAQYLFVDADTIDENMSFIDMGLDSVSSVEWIKQLNEQYNIKLTATCIYEYTNILMLSEYISSIVISDNLKEGVVANAGINKVIELASTDVSEDLPDDLIVEVSEYEDAIAIIKMKDSLNKNAFTNEMIIQLENAFKKVEEQDKYKVIILTGDNGYFATGGTKEALNEIFMGKVKYTDSDLYKIALECKIPVIAAINGHAIGAGWCMGMSCDFILMSEESFYSANFMKFGFTPGFGATAIFPMKFGDELANEILFTGNKYRGIDLKQRGVNFSILPSGQVLEEAKILSKSLAEAPKEAIVLLKENMNRDIRNKISLTIQEEIKMQDLTFVDNAEAKKRIDKAFSGKEGKKNSSSDSRNQIEAKKIDSGSFKNSISIIGMAGRFPEAEDITKYWDNIKNGVISVREVPNERWDINQYYSKNHLKEGKTNCRNMGAVANIDKFDARFFNVSPAEAESMDPQQRVFLEECWKCIEDAGINPITLSGTNCGVFVGCTTGDYGQAFTEDDVHELLGTSPAILSARISYLLNLKGPSMAIDTACSSSLSAIVEACNNLVLGNCDMALAGGVCFITTPKLHIMASKGGMLSPNGQCFTFDNRADGFVPGEGAGAILLKRTSDAIRDNDPIYGTIRGWGINQDGKTNGITAPSARSQSELETSVYEKYSINPRTITMVEAHGTGTKLGDPIEVEALTKAFGKYTKEVNYCSISSVKSNIGHSMAAAGIAGFIKTVCAINEKFIPPVTNYNNINEHINIENTPFYININGKEWISNRNRMAAISSFGLSGTNVHIVIEEFRSEEEKSEKIMNEIPLLISADSEHQIRKYAAKLSDFISKNQHISISNVAYTLYKGKDHRLVRAAVIVHDANEAVLRLNMLSDNLMDSYILTTYMVRDDESNNSVLNMARRWVKGEKEILESLFRDGKMKRIHIPPYVFRQERFWKHNLNLKMEDKNYKLLTNVWKPEPITSMVNDDELIKITMLIGFTEEQYREILKTGIQNTKIIYTKDKVDADTLYDIGKIVYEQIKEVIVSRSKEDCRTCISIFYFNDDKYIEALSGLIATAYKETNYLFGQLIGIERNLTNYQIADMIYKNKPCHKFQHLRYDGINWFSQAWEECTEELTGDDVVLHENGVYIISGGFGGLGQLVCQEICSKLNSCTVILLGTSAMDNKKSEFINQMKSQGAVVEYMQVDIADSGEMDKLSEKLKYNYPDIKGYIHSAGRLNDGLISNKNWEELLPVLDPKVKGVCLADHILADYKLDFFLIFGAAASVSGNFGQAAYAMGNHFLDIFAELRDKMVRNSKRSGLTKVIDWPLWDERGMRVSQEVKNMLRKDYNMGALPDKTGLSILYDSLKQKDIRILPMYSGDSIKIMQSHEKKEKEKSNPKEYKNTFNLSGHTYDKKRRYEFFVTYLKKKISEVTRIKEHQLDAYDTFESYGIDSLMIERLTYAINKEYEELPRTVFFDYSSIHELSEYLSERYKDEFVLLSDETNKIGEEMPGQEYNENGNKQSEVFANGDEIAIIGIDGQYPKADNLDEFWDNLSDGRECYEEYNGERWNAGNLYTTYAEEAIANNKIYCNKLGVLESFSEFDPLFFGISPKEAKAMDPQERIFLQSVWRALEDAGYTRDRIKEKVSNKVGVFVGVTKTGYEYYGENAVGNSNFEYIPQISFASIANRISYTFDFHGPSMGIDTMCSSSLTAIHEACMNIKNGNCKMAVAGGVNLYLHPLNLVILCQNRMLSEQGKCSPFGENADGFVPGEGVGSIILKPLSAARKDKDHIYGIIKGSGISHSGKTNGYTVPNSKSQARLINSVIEKSGIKNEYISYIEAHGTGTRLGDPIEIEGIKEVFSKRVNKNKCFVGSLKSNIGHLEAAAGIAGLTKIILQMNHKRIVPSINATKINSHIELENSPVEIAQEEKEWNPVIINENEIKESVPRIAGLTSIGAGGSCAFLLIEEYSDRDYGGKEISKGDSVIILSAKTEEKLKLNASILMEFINRHNIKDNMIHNIAYTLQLGREVYNYRIGIIANSIAKLKEYLYSYIECGKTEAAVYYNKGELKYTKEQSNKFLADDDMKAMIRSWVQKKKLDMILELWLSGIRVNWELLYDETLHTVSIPGYVFKKDRYWISDIPNKKVDTIKSEPINITNNKIAINAESPLIKEHIVDGQKVVPGALYIEIITEYLLKINNGNLENNSISIEGILWKTPYIVNNYLVSMKIKDLKNDTDNSHEISLFSEKDELVYCTGRLTEDSTNRIHGLDLSIYLNKMISSSDLYEKFIRHGITYGSAYQCLKEYVVLDNIAAAHLVNNLEMNTSVLPTNLLDAAFQSASILFSVKKEDTLLIPFSLAAVRIYQKVPNDLYVLTERVSESENHFTVNIRLIDINNVLLAELNEFSYKKVKRNVFSDRESMTELYTLKEKPFDLTGVEKTKLYGTIIFVNLSDNDKKMQFRKNASQSGYNLYFFDFKNYQEELQKCLKNIYGVIKQIISDEHIQFFHIVTNSYEYPKFENAFRGFLQTVTMESDNRIICHLTNIDYQWDISDIWRNLKQISQINRMTHLKMKQEKFFEKTLESYIPKKQYSQKKMCKDNGVYILTGGFGGLGKIIIQDIASYTNGTKLIILGRKSKRQTEVVLQSLRKHNCEVLYIPCDIVDFVELKEVMSQIINNFGRIDGIFNLAGINIDNYIRNKTEEEFATVLAPKIQGFINLDSVTEHLQMDFFICFSSGTSILGNLGQIDYSAANGFMDGLVQFRNELVKKGERHGHSITINWPLWKDGGMQVHDSTKQLMKIHGNIVPLDTAEGIRILHDIYNSGDEQVMVMSRSKKISVITDNHVMEQNEEQRLPEKEVCTTNRVDKNKLTEELKQQISEILFVPIEEIDENADLSDYGFDSISFTDFSNRINTRFHVKTMPTIFYEYPTLELLCNYLVEMNGFNEINKLNDSVQVPKNSSTLTKEFQMEEVKQKEPIYLTTKEEASDEKIAVIGMSGMFPQAENLDEFWNNMVSGKDCITEIPKERWDWKTYYGDPFKEKNKTDSKWGGFMPRMSDFDPQFFEITPREAKYMDPQQRLMMLHVWNALEDAGYSKNSIKGSNTGIFVATGNSGYGMRVQKAGLPIEAFSASGSVPSMGPNRISYFLDIHGPSEAIETACSSSLIAINRAVDALRTQKCNLSLAGGVNTIVSPEPYISYSKAGMLSNDGRCKTFAHNADGYVRGEGVGILVLKRLKDAKRDGDHIYGVILGASENHGGNANSLTAPNPNAQAEVIAKAYRDAKIDFTTVSYIEAHGTGTKLGDPIEIEGLKKAYNQLISDTRSESQVMKCGIGSVKTNIGHLELAAGIASVMKVLLQMKHHTLVKSLHCDQLNPYIELENTPFYIVRDKAEWKRKQNASGQELPFRAGVSSFGFGGVNAHLVLEEYYDSSQEQKSYIEREKIIVLSARTAEELKSRVKNLLTDSKKYNEEDFDRIVYTLQTGREAMSTRLGFVTSTKKEMEEKLIRILNDGFEDMTSETRTTGSTQNTNCINWDNSNIALMSACEVLDAWLKGAAVDWSKLYQGLNIHKIQLSGYPFHLQPYWVDDIRIEEEINMYEKLTAGEGDINHDQYIDLDIIETDADNSLLVDSNHINPAQIELEQVHTDTSSPEADNIRDMLMETLIVTMGLDGNQIQYDTDFIEMGLDSIIGIEWIQKINNRLNVKLDSSVLYDYRTVNKLADYLSGSTNSDTEFKNLLDKIKSGELDEDNLQKTLSNITGDEV